MFNREEKGSLPPSLAGKITPQPGALPGLPVLAGLAFLTILAVGVYLWSSSRVFGIGYPLDDSWIHQTYARNLGLRGEWAFVPGQPSAGSTSPLWSVLLSIGYLLRIPHFVWTFFLGGLSLFGLALAGEAFLRTAFLRTALPARAAVFPWAALFLIGEWHLDWAAVSGMETLLFAGLVLLVFVWLTRVDGRAWFGVGLLIGLCTWVRPDGITLLGPAGFCLLLRWPLGGAARDAWLKGRLREAAWLGGGVLCFVIPYVVFNILVQGSLLPNTFFAKQAEYAELQQISLLLRLLDELKLPLIGSGAFLLPGFFAFAWLGWRERRWVALAAVLWFVGYGLLYAIRLPVTYQYGRYFMPAMPVFFVAGLAGTKYLLAGLRSNRVGWLLARVGMLSGMAVWIAFFVIGAGRYAQDVAIIETEMVSAAKWVQINTEPDAIVAAHDIGALGYFSERRLLDLAGLVSPEVIPFIRDEERIAGWLDAEQADYLVIFSDWYQRLPLGKTPVFKTNGQYSIDSGGENIWVYRWRPEE